MKLFLQTFIFFCFFPLTIQAQSVPAPSQQTVSSPQPPNQNAFTQCTYSLRGEEVEFNGTPYYVAKASLVLVECGESFKEYFLHIRHIRDDRTQEELHYPFSSFIGSWDGNSMNEESALDVRPNGSLTLTTDESIWINGGYRSIVYTLSYRHYQYIISGISMIAEGQDQEFNEATGEPCNNENACNDETAFVQPSFSISFDLNLLTGRGVTTRCDDVYRNGRWQNSCHNRSIRFQAGEAYIYSSVRERAVSLFDRFSLPEPND